MRNGTIDGIAYEQFLEPVEDEGAQVIVTRTANGDHRHWVGWGFRSQAEGGVPQPPSQAQKGLGMAHAQQVYNDMTEDEIRRRVLATGAEPSSANGDTLREPRSR